MGFINIPRLDMMVMAEPQQVPAIQAITDADLRSAVDGAEDDYKRGYGNADVPYPNMKIEAIFDSPIKEKSPCIDLTGYSRVIFGEGNSRIEASVISGKLVLYSAPASGLVVVPMNSGAVRIETQPL